MGTTFFVRVVEDSTEQSACTQLTRHPFSTSCGRVQDELLEIGSLHGAIRLRTGGTNVQQQKILVSESCVIAWHTVRGLVFEAKNVDVKAQAVEGCDDCSKNIDCL